MGIINIDKVLYFIKNTMSIYPIVKFENILICNI